VHHRSAPSVMQRTLRVRAGDGVRLSGIAVPALVRPAPLTFVLAHGFTDSVAGEPVGRRVGRLRRDGGVRATVWVVPGMGHAESGMTAPRAERIGRWALDAVGAPAAGDTGIGGNAVVPAASGTIGE
jgi:hypothetical protein